MSRWFGVVAVIVLVVLAAGVGVTFLARARSSAADVGCKNNLREIVLFAAAHGNPDPKAARPQLPTAIPAGTVGNAALPPDERLSWFVTVLPGLDARRTDAAVLLAGLDRTVAWSAASNRSTAGTRVPPLLCPGRPPPFDAGQPAPTNYAGISGLGADAATLALGDGPPPPRAGCFRYDAPTPFDRVTDGLSQTLMVGEHEGPFGPWLQGGPSTVRGVDDASGAAARIAVDGTGQFGGGHPDAANFAFADGSVRPFTPRIDSRVFDGLATLAGGEGGVVDE